MLFLKIWDNQKIGYPDGFIYTHLSLLRMPSATVAINPFRTRMKKPPLGSLYVCRWVPFHFLNSYSTPRTLLRHCLVFGHLCLSLWPLVSNQVVEIKNNFYSVLLWKIRGRATCIWNVQTKHFANEVSFPLPLLLLIHFSATDLCSCQMAVITWILHFW